MLVQCLGITNRVPASFDTILISSVMYVSVAIVDPFFIHHTQMHGDNVKLRKANLFIKPHHYDSDHMVTKAR